MNLLRSITLGTLALLTTSVCAQDDRWAPVSRGQHLVNLDYVVDFDAKRGVANWVAYELRPAETVGETKRKSGFKRDERVIGSPVHQDYTHSGFDRGHLKPAADSKSSDARMAESFLMTNVAPQTPQLNRGSWKQLEEATRDWAKTHGGAYVVCGPGPGSNGRLASGKVDVPSGFWKAVLRTAPDTACVAFILPNRNEKLAPFPTYRVTVDSLESVIGIDLFPQLPNGTERRIEADRNSRWTGLHP